MASIADASNAVQLEQRTIQIIQEGRAGGSLVNPKPSGNLTQDISMSAPDHLHICATGLRVSESSAGPDPEACLPDQLLIPDISSIVSIVHAESLFCSDIHS